jgi:hypothetical protein
MFICCRNMIIPFLDCPIWNAALCVIRSKVSEDSSKEQLNECEKWIKEQKDRHWRIHLRSWLRYIERGKRDRDKDRMEELEVKKALAKFYSK